MRKWDSCDSQWDLIQFTIGPDSLPCNNQLLANSPWSHTRTHFLPKNILLPSHTYTGRTIKIVNFLIHCTKQFNIFIYIYQWHRCFILKHCNSERFERLLHRASPSEFWVSFMLRTMHIITAIKESEVCRWEGGSSDSKTKGHAHLGQRGIYPRRKARPIINKSK